jgi:hypothetical protein
LIIIREWPLRILTPTAIGLDLHWPTRSAGEALGGDEQIASALSARWQMSLSFDLSRRVDVLAYRGMKASLKGRYVAVRFPIFDPARVRRSEARWPALVPEGISFSDGSFFLDDTGFASADIVTTVAIDADLRAETIVLDVSTIGDALGFGHYLSITDLSLPAGAQDWLYIVTGTEDPDSGTRTFTIAPPLRSAISIGDEVQIGRPMSLFRLRDDFSGSLSLEQGRFGQVSMDFVEVMRRDSEA